MKIILTDWTEEQQCTWCEKVRDGVTASFGDGFLQQAPLCFACLQKAIRVRARQHNAAPSAEKSPAAANQPRGDSS